jgi:hypothetical protein
MRYARIHKIDKPNNVKSLCDQVKPKHQHKKAKIVYGHLSMRKINLSFNTDNISIIFYYKIRKQYWGHISSRTYYIRLY